jgi:hypothetical protein
LVKWLAALWETVIKTAGITAFVVFVKEFGFKGRLAAVGIMLVSTIIAGGL